MHLFAFEILGMWTLLAVVTGLCLGALIRKSEQIRLDEVLNRLLSMVENFQNSRPIPVNPCVVWNDPDRDLCVPSLQIRLTPTSHTISRLR